MTETTKPTCPACGYSEPFWRDPVPATGCLLGHQSAPCPPRLAEGRSMAARCRFCPEAFDANGNILPNGWTLIFAKLDGDRVKAKELL
jgi:hypothetical protein